MRKLTFNGRRHDVLTGILLAVLLFRAYVPVGFMPASGTPFLLELCPAASSASMPAHHGHEHDEHQAHQAGTHGHFENCPFGSTPAAGPISHLVVFQPSAQIPSRTIADFESLRLGVRHEPAHRPRGPPFLA